MSQIGLFKHNPKNPYNESYLYYKSLSPWKGEPIQENTKNFSQKAYYESIRFMMMHFPAGILAYLFGLKNRWYPYRLGIWMSYVIESLLCEG